VAGILAAVLAGLLVANSVRALIRRRPPVLGPDRIRGYLRLMRRDWIAAAAAGAILWLCGWPVDRAFLTTPRSGWSATAGYLGGTAVAVAVTVPIILRLGGEPAGYRQIQKLVRPMQSLLPRTNRERGVFVGVALTAGVCEELLFRGFLFAWLVYGPLGLSFNAGVVVSAVVFGAGHAYQGRYGVVVTALFGWIMGQTAISTHSLVAPMVMHTLVDLRAIVFARFVDEPTVTAARDETG
jgi:membrane protease YdiL (CAAX protease family)